MKENTDEKINLGRHKKYCTVCKHPRRSEIEEEWLNWGSTDRISTDFGLSRDSLYRHCHAFKLFDRRRKNLRRALERLIERGESVDLTASALVSAIQTLAKLNTNGQWIDRIEGVDLNKLFEKMTSTELGLYAEKGILPSWFNHKVGATIDHSHLEGNHD